MTLATLLAQGPVSASLPRDSDGDGLWNKWETHWGVTVSNLKDTNGNGLADSSEDPDGDGLSNLGEQRFHTNPGLQDTDGNGTPDGAEDANHNGVSNAAEQDQRPIPSPLTPSLANAKHDTAPSYTNGCHTPPASAEIHPCVFGDPHGTITVVMFGDSHALQWVPSFTRAARKEHWRLVAITKSGCPSVDMRFRHANVQTDTQPCIDWRQAAIVWLVDNPPDLIILSNRHGYAAVDDNGNPVPYEPAWADGLAHTLQALPAGSRRLVLGDTPHPSKDVPVCLTANPTNIALCETSRARAEDPVHDANERATAEANGATFVSLNALVCSYDPCPVIAGKTLMWSDKSHISATWSMVMWPTARALVRNALP